MQEIYRDISEFFWDQFEKFKRGKFTEDKGKEGNLETREKIA